MCCKFEINIFWTLNLTSSHVHPLAFCGHPDFISNGMRSYSGTIEGHTVNYTCNPGYRMSGVSRRICQSNGLWSGSQPSCESKLNRTQWHTTKTCTHMHMCTHATPPPHTHTRTQTCLSSCSMNVLGPSDGFWTHLAMAKDNEILCNFVVSWSSNRHKLWASLQVWKGERSSSTSLSTVNSMQADEKGSRVEASCHPATLLNLQCCSWIFCVIILPLIYILQLIVLM